MNKPVPSTPLEHASVGALRSCVLHDNPDINTTDGIPSVDIVRMCFGIAVCTPSQVEIMSNVINAVGGMRDSLVAVLRDKFANGPLWEFTTNFGITVVLSKIQHKDGINPLRLTMQQKRGDGSTEYRPLVEFTGGACKFFTVDDIEVGPVPGGFTFTTDTVKKEEINEPVQTTEDKVEPTPEPTQEPSQETLQVNTVAASEIIADSAPETEGLTAVESLQEEPVNNYLPVNTEVRVDGISSVRVLNKVHVAVEKIISTGTATMDLIQELVSPNIPKYNTSFEYKDGTVLIMLSVKGEEPPKPDPAPDPIPAVEPVPHTQEEVEAERRVKADLDTLLNAEATLRAEFEKCAVDDQIKLLQDFSVKIQAIDPVVRKELFSKNYPEVATKLATCFRDLTALAQANHEVQLAKKAAEEEARQKAIAEAIAAETAQHDVLVAEIAAGAAQAEENLNPEPTQEEKKEMIVRIDCAAEIPNEDYEKIKTRVMELWDPEGTGLTDAEKSKLITADIGYECNLATVKAGEEYVVSIPIEDDPSETKAEELEEAMQSDKRGEQQWLDLSDASVREPFIQILFPGISYPSYMHLMTFLKKFHTEEQTKTFIATKGSIPTETTIVYDNVTFCIVKMKESRFYRIFIANTDYSLADHSWSATNFTPNRWFRLGQDIHNPCFQNEGIIENRGGFHRGYGR